MVREGRLSADQGRIARRTPIQLAPEACTGVARRPAPFYSDQVERDLQKLVGSDVAAGGELHVETHLDPTLQEIVEVSLQRFLQANSPSGINQGAVVVLDSRNGGILSLGEGRTTAPANTTAPAKPNGSPEVCSNSSPIWWPLSEASGHQHRSRHRQSRGGPAIQPGARAAAACNRLSPQRQLRCLASGAPLQPDAVVRKSRDFGITTPMAAVPGLVLGQSETLLLELTAAYAAVANGGIWTSPSTIRRLTDTETCPLDPSDCATLPRQPTQPPGHAHRSSLGDANTAAIGDPIGHRSCGLPGRPGGGKLERRIKVVI